MINMNVDITALDLTSPVDTNDLLFDVQTYDEEVIGGSKKADIYVTGVEDSLWRTLEWLRHGVTIYKSEMNYKWLGYISGVTVNLGDYTVSISLDEVRNKVLVIYSEPVLYGSAEKKTTAWLEDTDSSGTWGVKETKVSRGNITTVQAEALRASVLDALRYPTPDNDVGVYGSSMQVVLHCKGWYDTASWRYFEQSQGFEAHTEGNKTQVLGLGFTATTLGFYADKNTIHDKLARLRPFAKDMKLQITGSTSNDGIYTVETGTAKEAAVYTASTIGLTNVFVPSRIYDSAKGLDIFDTNTQITISGASNPANNGPGKRIKGKASDGSWIEFDVDTVTFTDEAAGATVTLFRSTGTQITATTLSFQRGEDYHITDNANGLEDFDAGDMVYVSGASTPGNNTYYFIESSGNNGAYIKVDKALVTEAAGASITITRGNSIKVAEAITTEYPAASATIKVLGDEISQEWYHTASASWTVGEIGIKVKKEGTAHVDGLTITMYSDSAGVPGTALESVTVAASALPASSEWIKVLFLNTLAVAPSTIYHIGVKRSGSISATDYYLINVDEDLGYTKGDLRLKVSGAWSTARTPDADLAFRVIGYKETTQQIADIIDSVCAFIVGVDIIDASGVNTPQYRNGDNTADYEIRKLLEAGSTDGRRMLAHITPDRLLRIYKEPVKPLAGDAPYRLDRYGKFYDDLDRPVDQHHCLVGYWVDVDIIPAIVNANRIASISPAFIERNEINVPSGTQRPGYKNTKSIFDAGGLEDG